MPARPPTMPPPIAFACVSDTFVDPAVVLVAVDMDAVVEVATVDV